MIKKLRFQTIAYLYNAFFVTIVIVVIMLFFNHYISNVLTENTTKGMEQSVDKISSQLDAMVDQMDTLTIQVQFNEDLQNVLFDSLEYKGTENYFDVNTPNKSVITDILMTIVSSKDLARRICVFNGSRNYVSVGKIGNVNIADGVDLEKLSYLDELSKKKSTFALLPPHIDMWTVEERNKIPVISYLRSLIYTRGNNILLGYVEVQQPYRSVEEICTIQDEGIQVMVFNQKKEIIYPLVKNKEELAYYWEQVQSHNDEKSFIIGNENNRSKQLFFKKTSKLSNWTVVEVIPEYVYLKPVFVFQKLLIVFGAIILVLTLLLEFFIIKHLTSPIRTLRKTLKSVTIDNMPVISDSSMGGNNEIIQLKEAFNETVIKLQAAMKNIIKVRTSEAHAHFLALQAQMNPHFLFNSLMGISAMAQKAGSKEIISMCTQLSDMLRYVAAYGGENVALKEELSHMLNYLRLQKWRFDKNIDYEVSVDEELYEIKVPKLILQPLIENSFYHGFQSVPPPWKITVVGEIKGDRWILWISDNGSGFKEEAIREIMVRVEEYENKIYLDMDLEKMKLGGMGVLNIFVRLKLLYREDAVFSIDNSDNGGCTITLGGTLRLKAWEDMRDD